MKITPHFSWAEAEYSATAKRRGINNSIPHKYRENAKYIAHHLLEPLRSVWGKPLHISSWYRSGHLNMAIGGASQSDHLTASAVDIDQDVYGHPSNNDVFHEIKENFQFYKLIAEFPDNDGKLSWVHVSFIKEFNDKKHIYIAKKINGRTSYLDYYNHSHLVA